MNMGLVGRNLARGHVHHHRIGLKLTNWPLKILRQAENILQEITNPLIRRIGEKIRRADRDGVDRARAYACLPSILQPSQALGG